MGDSVPSEDDNTAEEFSDGGPGRAVPPPVVDPTSAGVEVSKPVSEPPSPPAVPSRSTDGFADPGTGQRSDIADWILEWGREQTSTTGDAEETQEFPALDPHIPPAAGPVIEGLKRTADTGDETPTIEPDRSDFIDTNRHRRSASETAAGAGSSPSDRLPSPPPVPTRTPSYASLPLPPVGDEPSVNATWSQAGADVALVEVDEAVSSRPEITESDIAKLARTTSTRSFNLGGVDVTFGSQRAVATVGALAMVLLVALMALLVSNLGDDSSRTATAEADRGRDAAVLDDDLLASGPPPATPNISELARSTVRVVGLDTEGNAVCVGSGVIVDDDGLILTNAHVVNTADDCQFASIGIAVTEITSEAPKLLYRAETLLEDATVDLAVLQVVGPLPSAPSAPFPRVFQPAVLGDSDEVELGDDIRILGYPVIGGDTITSTTGSVSGFSSQVGIGDRALIKTDATIAAGNSGGMALNDLGEVIGIPTRARATESGPAIDCRSVEDTNQDGAVDDADTCIPVGGFLNGIRPINLARDLLALARAERRPVEPPREVDSAFDLSGVVFTNPRFSTGEAENAPIDQVLAAPEGSTEICLFVDWTGIPEGVPWSAVWLVDGEEVGDFGRIDQVWDFGKDGRNFWYCAKDENGHQPGIYEMGLFLDEQLIFVEGVQVVESDAPVYDVTWVNQTEYDVCGLAINPLAESRHVGLNELAVDTVIGPGEAQSLELAAGDIVVEAYDCSGRAIAAELDGLRIPDDIMVDDESVPLVIGGPSADEIDRDG